MLFYCYLLYTSAWDIGARDKIKVDGGRMASIPLKGIYLALAANTLNILLALLAIIGYYLGSLLSLEWAAGMMAVCYNIWWLLNGMFNAVLRFAELGALKFWLMLVAVLPALISCGLAYFAGLKNFRLFGVNQVKKNK